MLSTASYAVSGLGASLVATDFNGDGVPDLALTQNDASGQGNVVIFLGKGDGTLLPPTKIPAGTGFAFYLVAGDFNGDGFMDLAVSNESNSVGGAGTVAVLLGQGNGTFSPFTSYTVGNFPGTVVAADFDNDGKLDLAVLDSKADCPM